MEEQRSQKTTRVLMTGDRLPTSEFVKLLSNMEESARELERTRKNRPTSLWVYYNPFTEQYVTRYLLFTENQFYEQVKPGLFRVCNDIRAVQETVEDQPCQH